MIIAPTPLSSVQDLNSFCSQLQLGIERVIGMHRTDLFGPEDHLHYLCLNWTVHGLSCTLEQQKPHCGVFMEVPPAASLQALLDLAQDIQHACAHPFGPTGTKISTIPLDHALDTARSVLVQNLLWNHLESWMDRGLFGLLGRTPLQEHARLTALTAFVGSEVTRVAPGVKERARSTPHTLGL